MNNLFSRSFWVGTAAERALFAPVVVGTRFYTSDTARLAIWTGTAWIEIGPGAAGAVAWGSITGTLSLQTDLQSALDAKANSSHTHTQSDVTNLVTALAGKEPANANIQTHIASTSNPHSTTAAQVGALATTAFSGLAKITVSATQPVGPSVGDLWISTA